MKTNTGLVEWVIKSYKRGDWYLNGGYFDRVVTTAYVMEKARQYPKRYTSSYIAKSMQAVGKIAGDCICLIKAYIWMDDQGNIIYPKDKATQTATDLGVDVAFSEATVKGNIKTIPEIPGVCVRFTGHVGVYIGNGEVIEARGVDYGVVKTRLKNRGLFANQWTDWYYYPGISYEEDIMLKKGDKGAAVYDYQTVMKALGYNIGKFLDMYDRKTPNGCDGDFGSGMETITKEAQSKYKLPVTGMVDGALYGKLSIALMNTSPALNKELAQAQADVTKYKKETEALKVKVSQLELQVKELPKLKADISAVQAKLISTKTQLDTITKLKDQAEDIARKCTDEIEKLQKAFGTIRTFIGG